MHHCDNVKPKKNWKSTWPKYIIYVSPDTNIGGINLNFEKKCSKSRTNSYYHDCYRVSKKIMFRSIPLFDADLDIIGSEIETGDTGSGLAE